MFFQVIRKLKQRLLFGWKQLKIQIELNRIGVAIGASSIVLQETGELKIGPNSFIGSFTVLWLGSDSRGGAEVPSIDIGSSVHIGDHCNIRAAGGEIVIGDSVMIANHVSMVTSNHGIELGRPMMEQPWSNEPLGILIGEGSWIGAHVMLLPGTRIGSGAIIAAGAVVRGEVPDNAIYGGVPARLIRYRQEAGEAK